MHEARRLRIGMPGFLYALLANAVLAGLLPRPAGLPETADALRNTELGLPAAGGPIPLSSEGHGLSLHCRLASPHAFRTSASLTLSLTALGSGSLCVSSTNTRRSAIRCATRCQPRRGSSTAGTKRSRPMPWQGRCAMRRLPNSCGRTGLRRCGRRIWRRMCRRGSDRAEQEMR